MLFYAVTIFLSAFLLFQVELVIAKHILPWFGGTPAVWTTCMLFFQVLLVGGYAYSHLVISKLRPRRQSAFHLLLLAGSLCLVAVQWWMWRHPVLPDAGWKPTGSDLPILRILALLAVAIGLPFFLLSATSSLLQAWFARAHPGRSPYRLYALSNAGSLLALLSYPFLVEPALALKEQAGIWAGGYAAFALCCGWCAVRARSGEPAPGEPAPEEPAEPHAEMGEGAEPPPAWGRRLLWLILPACSSVLLLATTNQISEEIAVVPFLWVLPLSLYLLSFIICFDSPRWYIRPIFAGAALLILAAGVWFAALEDVDDIGLLGQIAFYSVALFIACMICHGELVRLKPAARRLTSFYLSVSIGGAVGGVFVAVVAPGLFSGLWELYVGYFGCGLLLALLLFGDKASWLNSRRFWWRWLWTNVTLLALVVLAVGPFVLLQTVHEDTIASRRNFYGIIRIEENWPDDPEYHRFTLYHARTEHGFQYRRPEWQRRLTAYYTERSGVGLCIENHPRRLAGRPMRIGVVGLGAGVVAAYGRRGDFIRFYEINPAVVEIAAGRDSYFSFVRDSRARTEVVVADARIALEREPDQGFDVLVLDAFSGDTPPVHLLTREAFQTYVRHLREGGVLAVHVSNRYLHLAPVVWKAADAVRLDGVAIDAGVAEDEEVHVYATRWMLLTSDRDFLAQENIANAAQPREETDGPVRLWTDDYSNLFQVLE